MRFVVIAYGTRGLHVGTLGLHVGTLGLHVGESTGQGPHVVSAAFASSKSVRHSIICYSPFLKSDIA